jgi:PBSX family phage terminase large subunit
MARDGARINLWEGSVRSSKTISSLLAWLEYTRTGPAGNLAMIGKTERTLKRNVIDPLIEMLGPKRCRYVAGAGELWILGRRVYVAGANNEASVSKIQGLTLAGAYVDEVTTMPESFWSMLLTRLSVDGAQLFGTCNPDNPNHWLMKGFLKRARIWLRHDGTVVTSDDPDALDLTRFSFRLSDNPHLSAEYIAALAAEFTGLWRKRYIEGLWVLAEGAIFDTFDPTPGNGHVVTTLPRIDRWVLAIDYGTTNPFVALLIGLGRDDRLYVAREWRWDSRAKHRQMTDGEYSTALRRWLDELDPPDNEDLPGRLPGARTPEKIIYDPSAASFGVQLWRDGWTGVHTADNTVGDGIRTVSTLLSAGRLKIHESCSGLIAEQTSYVWDEKAAEKGVEQPLKVDDHGPDAERYGVMGTRSWWRHWIASPLDEAA